ncbi:MAG: hypothetical protein RLZ56_1, partial [Bacteroidota bacterium]
MRLKRPIKTKTVLFMSEDLQHPDSAENKNYG